MTREPSKSRSDAAGPDGLTPWDRQIIRDAIAKYPRITRVTLFGSRAMGTFGRGSDIDLALEGRDLDQKTLALLAGDLEESNLPFKVDLLHRTDSLDDAVEEHIKRYGKPFGWRRQTLGKVIELKRGYDLPASERRPGAVPVVSSSGVSGRHDQAKVTAPGVVTGRYGTLGQVHYLTQNFWPLNTTLYVRDFKGSDERFVAYLLRSMDFLGASDKSSVPGLNRNDLHQFEVSVPPLPEQRAIAGVLGALDDKIEQNRRTSRALERLAKAIFKAWFVDFEPVKAKAASGGGATGFPSMPQAIFDALPDSLVDSEIGLIPKGWAVKPIGDVVTINGGATPSTKVSDYWEGGTHCWATPKDLSRLSDPVLLDTARRITDAGVAQISSRLLPVETVLLSSRAPVGYVALAGVWTAINQGFIAMVCDGPLPPVYILNWAHYAMGEIKGRASGTTFAEISKAGFRPIPVVVPAPAVVQAFRELAEPLFHLITATVKETAKLQRMRDYLLPRLLSGQVRVHQAERLVEEAV